MARVLILSLIFPPDGVSTAVIMGELAIDLKAAGHDVRVVTTVPHYNKDVVAEARQPLRRVFGPLLYRSDFHGVPVFHVAMPRKGPRVVARLLAWVQFHMLSYLVAVARVRRVDVIVAPSPPLTIGPFAWLLGVSYRAPFVYIVQEIYPDIAVTLGVLKSRWLITPLFALERFVYSRASRITVIAERMRRRLLEKGVAPEKVVTVPNFVDVTDMRPVPKRNAFSKKHGLADAFVVSYAGNMGPAQGLDTLLEAATLLRADDRVKFLLVGDGGIKPQLEAIARDRGLGNVKFLPHHPYEVVPEIYGASDLCLVALAPKTGAEAAPSKVYRIMACARPVLACADEDSELASLVRTAGCGFVSPSGNAQALAETISAALVDPRGKEMGARGRVYVIDHFDRSVVSQQYDTVIRGVLR